MALLASGATQRCAPGSSRQGKRPEWFYTLLSKTSRGGGKGERFHHTRSINMNNGWRTKKSTLLSDISVLALAGGFATTAALAGSAFAVGLFKPVTTAAPAMVAQPACA